MATTRQHPALVREPAPGLESGCFLVAYGALRCVDTRLVHVGTHASRGWRIQGRFRCLGRRTPRTEPERSLVSARLAFLRHPDITASETPGAVHNSHPYRNREPRVGRARGHRPLELHCFWSFAPNCRASALVLWTCSMSSGDAPYFSETSSITLRHRSTLRVTPATSSPASG